VPGGESAPWLITLADLVLVLLCMFTVLATRSEGEQDKGANTAPVVANGAEQSTVRKDTVAVIAADAVATGAEAVDTAAAEPPLEPGSADMERGLREIFRPAGGLAEIERVSGELTVRLRDSISFLSGSAELLPSVLPFLDGITDLLTAYPGVRIETSGHTDGLPIATSIYPSNWELSTARAAAVARYLLGHAALDPTRVRVAGYAEHRPIDPGHTPEGRARNRRVEIRFLAQVPRRS
jgi:chemotaxis protein MotB